MSIVFKDVTSSADVMNFLWQVGDVIRMSDAPSCDYEVELGRGMPLTITVNRRSKTVKMRDAHVDRGEFTYKEDGKCLWLTQGTFTLFDVLVSVWSSLHGPSLRLTNMRTLRNFDATSGGPIPLGSGGRGQFYPNTFPAAAVMLDPEDDHAWESFIRETAERGDTHIKYFGEDMYTYHVPSRSVSHASLGFASVASIGRVLKSLGNHADSFVMRGQVFKILQKKQGDRTTLEDVSFEILSSPDNTSCGTVDVRQGYVVEGKLCLGGLTFTFERRAITGTKLTISDDEGHETSLVYRQRASGGADAMDLVLAVHVEHLLKQSPKKRHALCEDTIRCLKPLFLSSGATKMDPRQTETVDDFGLHRMTWDSPYLTLQSREGTPLIVEYRQHLNVLEVLDPSKVVRPPPMWDIAEKGSTYAASHKSRSQAPVWRATRQEAYLDAISMAKGEHSDLPADKIGRLLFCAMSYDDFEKIIDKALDVWSDRSCGMLCEGIRYIVSVREGRKVRAFDAVEGSFMELAGDSYQCTRVAKDKVPFALLMQGVTDVDEFIEGWSSIHWKDKSEAYRALRDHKIHLKPVAVSASGFHLLGGEGAIFFTAVEAVVWPDRRSPAHWKVRMKPQSDGPLRFVREGIPWVESALFHALDQDNALIHEAWKILQGQQVPGISCSRWTLSCPIPEEFEDEEVTVYAISRGERQFLVFFDEVHEYLGYSRRTWTSSDDAVHRTFEKADALSPRYMNDYWENDFYEIVPGGPGEAYIIPKDDEQDTVLHLRDGGRTQFSLDRVEYDLGTIYRTIADPNAQTIEFPDSLWVEDPVRTDKITLLGGDRILVFCDVPGRETCYLEPDEDDPDLYHIVTDETLCVRMMFEELASDSVDIAYAGVIADKLRATRHPDLECYEGRIEYYGEGPFKYTAVDSTHTWCTRLAVRRESPLQDLLEVWWGIYHGTRGSPSYTLLRADIAMLFGWGLDEVNLHTQDGMRVFLSPSECLAVLPRKEDEDEDGEGPKTILIGSRRFKTTSFYPERKIAEGILPHLLAAKNENDLETVGECAQHLYALRSSPNAAVFRIAATDVVVFGGATDALQLILVEGRTNEGELFTLNVEQFNWERKTPTKNHSSYDLVIRYLATLGGDAIHENVDILRVAADHADGFIQFNGSDFAVYPLNRQTSFLWRADKSGDQEFSLRDGLSREAVLKNYLGSRKWGSNNYDEIMEDMIEILNFEGYGEEGWNSEAVWLDEGYGCVHVLKDKPLGRGMRATIQTLDGNVHVLARGDDDNVSCLYLESEREPWGVVFESLVKSALSDNRVVRKKLPLDNWETGKKLAWKILGDFEPQICEGATTRSEVLTCCERKIGVKYAWDHDTDNETFELRLLPKEYPSLPALGAGGVYSFVRKVHDVMDFKPPYHRDLGEIRVEEVSGVETLFVYGEPFAQRVKGRVTIDQKRVWAGREVAAITIVEGRSKIEASIVYGGMWGNSATQKFNIPLNAQGVAHGEVIATAIRGGGTRTSLRTWMLHGKKATLEDMTPPKVSSQLPSKILFHALGESLPANWDAKAKTLVRLLVPLGIHAHAEEKRTKQLCEQAVDAELVRLGFGAAEFLWEAVGKSLPQIADGIIEVESAEIPSPSRESEKIS